MREYTIPLGASERKQVLEILQDNAADRLPRAFEVAMGGNFRCVEVIGETATAFSCWAERASQRAVDGKSDGLRVKARMAFGPRGITSIVLDRQDSSK